MLLKGFLDKNKDTLQEDLLEVLVKAKDPFIRDMFIALFSLGSARQP
jgi:myosin heavy subunit